MIRHLVFLVSLTFVFAACNSAPKPVASDNSNAAVPQRSERTETVIAHTTENQLPPSVANSSTGKSKWTQSGDPIDTKEFDAAIAAAEKTAKTKPDDTSAKSELSQAYYKRAVALTDARQYASALGDYRRALKYDPDNADAKNWVEQIMSIYDSLGREAPPEGQEPPPLPYKKGEK